MTQVIEWLEPFQSHYGIKPSLQPQLTYIPRYFALAFNKPEVITSVKLSKSVYNDQSLNPLQMMSSESFIFPSLMNRCDQVTVVCTHHCGNFLQSAKKRQVSFGTALLLH